MSNQLTEAGPNGLVVHTTTAATAHLTFIPEAFATWSKLPPGLGLRRFQPLFRSGAQWLEVRITFDASLLLHSETLPTRLGLGIGEWFLLGLKSSTRTILRKSCRICSKIHSALGEGV